MILAGISIAQLTGNGLFEKAKLAKEESKNAQEDEDRKILEYGNEISGYISGNRDYETEINNLKSEIQALKNANSYSTDEQVVGKWTDGRNVYQKTLVTTSNFTLQCAGDWQAIPGWSAEFSNIDKFILAKSHHGWANRTDWLTFTSANGNKYLKFYSTLSYFDIPSGTYLTVQYVKI